MLTTMLAATYPDFEDPGYRAYEQDYPEYRRTLEDRYPQICANCESQAREHIRKTSYEAKTDHLRRMLIRTEEERAARRMRRRSWRAWLVYIGAIAHWVSIIGQLAWDIIGALDAVEPEHLKDPDHPWSLLSIFSFVFSTLWTRRVPSHCSTSLAPLAGLCLLAGLLSIWWNPMLRRKVEERRGRLVGLGDYYKVQLIVMVTRCVFWAMLKDPSSSGLQGSIPPALHLFMIALNLLVSLFIMLLEGTALTESQSVAISRGIIKYDTTPLVSWKEITPTASPSLKPQDPSSTNGKQSSTSTSRFPFEKLAAPPEPEPAREPQIPTPPPEVDDMDWTPTVQHEIRPTVSVHQRNEKSVLDGPLPFYGSLPPAPQHPAWKLRNPPAKKPIEQVIEPNPFHRAPTQSPPSWKQNPDPHEPEFAPPKFFPPSDHAASTGLESLFDRTFTIRSPGEEGKQNGRQQPKKPACRRTDVHEYLLFQYFRLGLLLVSIVAWVLSQSGYLPLPANYIEVTSLGSASLIAGFGLLDVLKQPMVQWNGMEIVVYIAELVAPVHLGYNLPRASFERQYFDRYGKVFLVFMAAQEALGLFFYFWAASAEAARHQARQPTQQPTQPEARSRETSGEPTRRKSRRPSESQSSLPALSFSSTAPGSSFSTQASEPQYHMGFSSSNKKFAPSNKGFGHYNQGSHSNKGFGHYNQGFHSNKGSSSYNQGFGKDHSFSLESLKNADLGGFDDDRDSDTESNMTTATTATNYTNNTVRNIRYGRNTSSKVDSLFSPNRSGLGPRIGGLSLEDRPARVTRSQTQQLRNGGHGHPTRRVR